MGSAIRDDLRASIVAKLEAFLETARSPEEIADALLPLFIFRTEHGYSTDPEAVEASHAERLAAEKQILAEQAAHDETRARAERAEAALAEARHVVAENVECEYLGPDLYPPPGCQGQEPDCWRCRLLAAPAPQAERDLRAMAHWIAGILRSDYGTHKDETGMSSPVLDADTRAAVERWRER